MTYRNKLVMLLFVPLMGLTACTQTTPSMMNSAPLTVSEETIIDQISFDAVTSATIAHMANYYLDNATGALGLALTYDPRSKSFGRSRATKEVAKLADILRHEGVETINTRVMPVANSEPVLVINYDSAVVNGPAGCGETPGLKDYQTGRFIGDYKFGCGVENMFAKQVSDPTDLYGNSGLGPRQARRAAIVVENDAAGVRNTSMQGVETNERLGQ